MAATQTGRRAQKRAARYEQLTTAAAEIIAESGLDGLTMLAVAERVDCAVGTIYTYFDSKSSLIAELQISAMRVLMDSVDAGRVLWERAIDDAGLDERTAALVRVVAAGYNFTAAPQLHPREFELLQFLISQSRRQLTPEDTRKVIPTTMAMLGQVHEMIASAVDVGALHGQGSDASDSSAVDSPLLRTIRWASGLNGALLVSNATADPDWYDSDMLNGPTTARALANDMILGWGADRELLSRATSIVNDLESRGQLLRPGRPVSEIDAALDAPVVELETVVSA